MKKKIIINLFLLFFLSTVYSSERQIIHSYNADYSLFPDTPIKDRYINKLSNSYPVRYCVQAIYDIPKNEANGYSCEQVLHKLDQMGGLEKECFGVSYIDGNSGERKPIFKKSKYDEQSGELYVKDKAAGGLHLDVSIDRYFNNGNTYVVNGIINRRPDNIFVRGIKKNEAEIFVLMEEKADVISVYALIQCSYSPLELRFLKSFVENAVTARVVEIQNWFYRMLCGHFN